MQNSIIKNRVAYFSMGSRSVGDCYLYARKRFPWYTIIHVCEPLNLVAVFASKEDFYHFYEQINY